MTCLSISSTTPNLLSSRGRLASEFNISFGESPAVAAAMAETADRLYRSDCDLTLPGNILYSAVHLSEPAGKPLDKCKRVYVRLSLWEESDDSIKDTKTRRKAILQRIATQAYDQDGVLTIEDCRRILVCSSRAIKNYISEYKAKDIFLPLRGYVHSTGRGQTHKTEIICLYLEGMQFEDIQKRTYHSVEAVSRYIRMFSRIVVCHAKQGMKARDIATVVGCSSELVEQYLKIYEKYSKEENERLELILDPVEFDNAMTLKKKIK